MTPVLLNPVAQVSAERLLDALVIGLFLAAFAAVLLRVFPQQSSSTRFAVWFAALLGTALVPLTGLVWKAAAHVSVPHALIDVPASWALYVFAAWILAASMALLRVMSGLFELRRLRRRCKPVADAAWQQTIARICPARRIEIFSSDRVNVPAAVGFFRPAIIIPARFLQELSATELNQVLLHEVAHLRRWDDWTNVVQKFVSALLFFHPGVWWMERRISLEREMACDEAVIAETASPRAYAECLAMLAEKSVLSRSAALAQAAVHHIRQTTLRVARILASDRAPASPVGRSVVPLAGGVAFAAILLVWQATPQLIAFQDAPPMLATVLPAPIAAPVRQAGIISRPSGLNPAARPRRPRPAAIPATVARVRTPLPQPGIDAVVPEPRHHLAGMIPARALQPPSVLPQAAFTTGLVVIFVDDPIFGPTPLLWRFAIWQVPAPPAATRAAPATPQKSI